MPTVDTAYIVGVIREWENNFLEEDEYTRLIEADNNKEALHTLMDTPYGKWINEEEGVGSVTHAVTRHLNSIRLWLTDKITDERVLQFISARYDALNIGTCLVQKKNGQEKPGELSQLGSIDHSILHTSIWNDIGWQNMPEYWELTIRETISDNYDTTKTLQTIADKNIAWLSTLAFTPLGTAIARHEYDKQKEANQTRPIKTEQEAISFELKWDEKLISLLREHKHEPIGYDPILAFWYAKEMEGKNIRTLLTAKLAGTPKEEIQKLKRTFYRHYD